jgi:hypothetical protein
LTAKRKFSFTVIPLRAGERFFPLYGRLPAGKSLTSHAEGFDASAAIAAKNKAVMFRPVLKK